MHVKYLALTECSLDAGYCPCYRHPRLRNCPGAEGVWWTFAYLLGIRALKILRELPIPAEVGECAAGWGEESKRRE